ncbi:MAG: hypothetical protein HOV94_36140, partial [Saccharothrix sp.]|nr:hypothetical protein [Saccharothrix sp.]
MVTTGTETLWDDLVSTALVGTAKRAVPGVDPASALGTALGGIARRDEAERLLDLAALALVHRRAGRLPGTGATALDACAPDARPAVPERARARLRLLLGSGTGERRTAIAELLPEWLAEARARGYRAPESELPALLDIARSHTELRADVAALAGPRGRWLARLNPDWSWATRIAAEDVAVAGGAARTSADGAGVSGRSAVEPALTRARCVGSGGAGPAAGESADSAEAVDETDEFGRPSCGPERTGGREPGSAGAALGHSGEAGAVRVGARGAEPGDAGGWEHGLFGERL